MNAAAYRPEPNACQAALPGRPQPVHTRSRGSQPTKLHRLLSLAAPIAGALALMSAGCTRQATEITTPPTQQEVDALPTEYALLTAAPEVPPPLARTHAAHVIVDLEVREVVGKLADGVNYTFWTFGGTVPGLFIRVREGDYVEMRLHNHPTSKMPHNIDLHAVSGPGGGAASTFTAPGHTSTFCFTAMNPGLFVYHCATEPVPMHVANGMYGLILVEPKGGLPKVDREYYLMQGEVYTAGRFGEPGLQSFDTEKAADERPPYVVFNGQVGALTGSRAITARTGESVRVFFGDGGPNLTSSLHIIGQVFSSVYQEGGTTLIQHNVQTTVVAPGGATIVEMKTKVPGNFAIVDHSLSRAFGKGALGILKVEGGVNNKLIYSGKISDTAYNGSPLEAFASSRPHLDYAAPDPALVDPPPGTPLTKEMRIARGKVVFSQSCIACHQANGKGLPGVFPPLADSDYLRTHRERIATIPVKGLSGSIVVNGQAYNGLMPPQAYTDDQLANALTYVLNTWGNNLGVVEPGEVKQVR